MTANPQIFAFVGNWDRHKSPPKNGFGICRFDTATGTLISVGTIGSEITVGSACLNPERTILYCADEYTTLPGYYLGGGGQLYAFRIDPDTGALVEIGRGPSFGSLPSSISIDATGKYLIATHHTDRTPVTKIIPEPTGSYRISLEYDDATTVLFPLLEDGTIGEPCDVFKHTGSGGPLPRQTHPQLHSVTRAPSENLFVVCDKGNDELLSFCIDYSAKRLRLCCSATKTIPGSSPRYSAFHPTLPYVFVNHETKAIVSSYRYNPAGALTLVSQVSALPPDCEDNILMKQSDIQVHPSGNYVYSLVRGTNSVAVFEINRSSGAIQHVSTVKLDVNGPRACAISPEGKFMLIAALDSKIVLVCKIGQNGTLTPTSHTLSQPNPGTITFFEPTRS